MNFLIHLYLSGDDSGLLAGNIMGDFVKGRLTGQFPTPVERGLELHRRIDSFSALNSHYIRSKRRISPSFGHYRGIMVDLFYDHFMARDWSGHSSIGLAAYLSNTRTVVEQYWSILPERLKVSLPYIFSELIPSYVEESGISRALVRISSRLKRKNLLGEGGAELQMNYEGFRSDFRLFLPELREFVKGWKEENNRGNE
jgi:acyl carrier protein phosphodiesterase